MKKYWKYLNYLLQHKWLVLKECAREGIIWQGLFHDLSKLGLNEFSLYARKFFGTKPVPEELEARWQYAWLHHQHHNKHHWNYWIVDQINKTALPIPEKFVREMVCDWRAMARKFNCNPAEMYFGKRETFILHPESRRLVEKLLGIDPHQKPNRKEIEINYISGGAELLDLVGPLWEKLNQHHAQICPRFLSQFNKLTFTVRKEKLAKKMKEGQIRVYLARIGEAGNFIGYCVASIDGEKIGEIESIFVEKEFRELQIGSVLIRKALDWLDQNQIKERRIGVVTGNERAFPFYERHGFYPRYTTLMPVPQIK